MTSLNYYFLFKTVVFSNFFLVKNYCFNTFSSPGLDLKLKNVFSRSDEVTGCCLLFCDVTLLLILIENVVLEFSQEKMSITNVSIALL